MRGQNLVTPGDLGKRATMQFELPNGTLFEAVGVFERWDADASSGKDGGIADARADRR